VVEHVARAGALGVRSRGEELGDRALVRPDHDPSSLTRVLLGLFVHVVNDGGVNGDRRLLAEHLGLELGARSRSPLGELLLIGVLLCFVGVLDLAVLCDVHGSALANVVE